MGKKPYEVFSEPPDIASQHIAVLSDVRYVGFRPKGEATRPIAFRGLPYAMTPDRLTPPAPFKTAKQEINCCNYGPACWQPPLGMRLFYEGLGSLFKEMLFPSAKPGFSKAYGQFSEECLNLNIWTPNLDDKKRAVMVWIHGGAFKCGSNIELGLYNGEHLSQKGDVVVVSINYRFGLFALHLPDEGITNLSLQDQIFALKWVRDHIEKFGGDPNNITIFGESAGAISVNHLLASPKAKGLFHKAIAQSGGSLSLTASEYQKIFATAAKQFNVNQIRAIGSPRELLKYSDKIESTLTQFGSSKGGYFPLRDGKFVDKDGAVKGIEKGNGSKVPLLIGSNAEEMKLFTVLFGILFPTNKETVIAALRAHLDLLKGDESPEQISGLTTQADKLIAAFSEILQAKSGETPKKKKVIETVLTFVEFTLGIYELAAAQAKVNGDEVYTYLFRFGSEKFGASHGAELPFIWNFGAPYEEYFCSEFDFRNKKVMALADEMQQAWINFAKTGKPSAIHHRAWEPFPNRMNLDLNSYVDNWQSDVELAAWVKSTPP